MNPAPNSTPESSIINELANEFLRWPLPESVCADLCATKQGPGRVGTNLLSFVEAQQMFNDLVMGKLYSIAKDRIEALQHESNHLSSENERLTAGPISARTDSILTQLRSELQTAKERVAEYAETITAILAELEFVGQETMTGKTAAKLVRAALAARQDKEPK